MITNQEYWNEVKATDETVVETAFDNMQYDGIESPTIEQVYDSIFDNVLHETGDSHQWVIYTAYHLPVLQHTDNADYMVGNFGGDCVEQVVKESGVTGLHQAMAYWALYADIADQIDFDFIAESLGDKVSE
jgi:lysine/ornithine N-monooxygenase